MVIGESEAGAPQFLILFSAWAPDDSANSISWASFYRNLLIEEFPNDDKVIALNVGSSHSVINCFSGIPNTLSLENTPEKLAISSDASGFQHCLWMCKDIVSEYDAVVFIHTKGISYSWEEFRGVREGLMRTIWSRSRLVDAFSAGNSRLVADRGHLPNTPPSWREVVSAAALLELPLDEFTFAATLTLYAVSATTLSQLLQSVRPSGLLTDNLAEQGFNRYFFEGTFPSLLSHLADELVFLGGAGFQQGVSCNVSADAFPQHNSQMVLVEYNKYKSLGHNYRQVAYPYIFGSPDALLSINVQYQP